MRQAVRRGVPTQAGLTLVELLIGILLFSIIAAGALAAMSGQQRTSQAQRRAADALDGARATLNAITQQIRASRGGIPDGNVAMNNRSNRDGSAECAAGSGKVPLIQVASPANGSDTLRVLAPDGSAWGTVVASVSPADTQVTVRTADGASPNISSGDLALLTDFTNGALLFRLTSGPTPCSGESCLGKSAANPGSWASPTPSPFAVGSFFARARWLSYTVDTSFFGSELPSLDVTDHALTTTQTQPAAPGIEDLQVALWFDLDSDGEVDEQTTPTLNGDEVVFNYAGETVAATSGVSSECDLQLLRAVRVSIVARASSQDRGATNLRPALEDRSGSTVEDGYYRVVLRSFVALRN